ncbi:alpha/beta fold hydrolase [Streptomyces sp. NPDC005402]|uniref:alpha/beta hydrolase n=1 Tax=Streptomyces sp. NPDC005402 TaxID=3155338 RepID=UPI0033AA464A
MRIESTDTRFRALDGLYLAGTLTLPAQPRGPAVVLLHGNGVTREECGLFTRLAAALGRAGVPSLRFDLRAHGESEGSQQDRTLSSHLNDIRVALAHVREMTGVEATNLVGTSFSGGLAAYYAAKQPTEVGRLVLLNPQLDHKHRFIDQKPWWVNDFLDEEQAQQLRERGFLDHSPTVQHGRALLNEVFWIRAFTVLDEILAPTLIVHGTEDTFVPIDSSHAAIKRLKDGDALVQIEGAAHGFAVRGDPDYLDPQTHRWQAIAIQKVVDWLTSPVHWENMSGQRTGTRTSKTAVELPSNLWWMGCPWWVG